jgi:hypothetical protein
MRLRIHDDGRWAIHTGEVWRIYRAEVAAPHVALDLHEPGWHEAIVLPVNDTGARRLAEAWHGAGFRSIRWQDPFVEHARAVLDRLAEGGERDA